MADITLEQVRFWHEIKRDSFEGRGMPRDATDHAKMVAALDAAIKQREQDKRDAVQSGIAMALGWMYQEACRTADAGLDIRTARVPDLLERALRDLAPEDSGNG